ncbi:MAG: hypothetical protein ISP10_08345 [Aeromicrobium sp.]|nr:hypothetical protein [Aeromicrobium sp.]
MHDREWVELGRIDYFLEHLARAVERGEVERRSYDSLAPRYLERRAELVRVISGGTAHTASAPLPVAPPPVPRRERTPLSWTTVLVVTGAFLVIVAAAIFALATWELFGPVFQFGFLSTLTVAFYAAGALVRRRLDSSAGGVALISVASAMLLFDGWILISGFGLSGPWPWALWLLVCSVVYWYTELRLTGGVFGIAGAAAEIAWWWLLGEGLGWDPLPRLAGISVVAVVWAYATVWSRRIPGTAQLATVLRYAAPITIGLAAFGAVSGVTEGTPDAVVVLSALVIAWSGTAVAEALTLPRPLGALAHGPLVLAGLVAIAAGADSAGVVALLLVASGAAAAYETMRGGALYGLTAPVLGAAAVAVLGTAVDVSAGMRVALVAVVAAVWPVAGSLLRAQLQRLPAWFEGASGARAPLTASAIGVLGVATLLTLPVLGTIPLAGMGWTRVDTFTVGLVCLAWAIAAFGGRVAVAALGCVLTTFLLLAGQLEPLVTGWESASIAIAFLALALAWVLARDVAERASGLLAEITHVGMRLATPLIVIVALAADGVRIGVPHWSAGVLLGAAALWWAADRVISAEAWATAPVAVLGTAAAAVLGWWWGVRADGAVAAAVFAVSGAAMGVLMRRRPGMGAVFVWTLVVSAAAFSALAVGDAGAAAVALAITAGAAALSVASSGFREGAFFGVMLATAALLAALEHLALAPWLSLAALGAAGLLCLVPAFALGDGRPLPTARLAGALAAGGLLPLGAGAALGFLATAGAPLSAWADLSWHLYAVAIMLVGAYVLALAVRYRLESSVYVGMGVLMLALFAELRALDVRWAELYSTPAALYIAWCGYRWARHAEGRRVPLVTDVGAVAVALGVPFLAMLDPFATTMDSWVHTFAVFGLGIVAVVLGVVLRVRGYFFGGVAALVLTALVRSWDVLVMWWWLVLGVVGTGMIVVALARELRQAMAEGVRDLLDGWR